MDGQFATGRRGTHMGQENIRTCLHCGFAYDWRRSPSSSLKMTYCGSLCEKADLGFTIETLLADVEFVKPQWRMLLAA